MADDVLIRHVEQGDLQELLELYNWYVTNVHSNLHAGPHTLEEHQAWLDRFTRDGRYQCFVAIKDGKPIGWASTVQHRAKKGFDNTVEMSLYMRPDVKGAGLEGRRLFARLMEAMKAAGVHRVVGGVARPNDAIEALVLSFGFTYVGTFHEVGYKFGKYWDVAWYEYAP